MNTLQEMRQLMASTKNFGNYRETLRQTNPPCVPFLGMSSFSIHLYTYNNTDRIGIYLTDFVFIEDGIPNQTPNGMINFSKRSKIAGILQDIQQFQNTPYLLQPVPELQDYLGKGLESAKELNEMYERSMELEPRQRHEEALPGHVPYAATGSHMSSVVIASMAMR